MSNHLADGKNTQYYIIRNYAELVILIDQQHTHPHLKELPKLKKMTGIANGHLMNNVGCGMCKRKQLAKVQALYQKIIESLTLESELVIGIKEITFCDKVVFYYGNKQKKKL
jgi:hypothetical protein